MDQGNFLNTPTTNIADFQALSANFNQSVALDNAQFNSMNSFAESLGFSLSPNADGQGFAVTAVPEPATLTLIGGSIAAMGFFRPRRRKNKAATEGGAKA